LSQDQGITSLLQKNITQIDNQSLVLKIFILKKSRKEYILLHLIIQCINTLCHFLYKTFNKNYEY